MDPLSLANAELVKAVQALLVQQGSALEASPLLSLLGQDVDLLLQALTPDGVKLKLPSGQTVTAQGNLPYPEGTQLRVRVAQAAPGESGVRLQLREATPPALPALLAPLVQSEAQTLMTRLAQPEPPAELLPLVRLLSVLADVPPANNAAVPPSAERLQAALRLLPEPQLLALGKALGMNGTVTPTKLAEAVQAWIGEGIRAADTLPPTSSLSTVPTERMAPAVVEHLLTRFQTLLLQHPTIPPEHRDALTTWLRHLLARENPEAPSLSSPSPARTDSARLAPPARPGEPPVPLQPTPSATASMASKADAPESWETWIRTTVTTLTQPTASPREAPFHALQAKEGTAYFEIPLPWPQASPMQIWVEADAPDDRQPARDATKRVLLGLRFSQLGETRLGLAQGAFGLRVRVWTEHPERLESQRPAMEAELRDLAPTVDLRIFALTYSADGTIPTIRSLVAGPSLSALG